MNMKKFVTVGLAFGLFIGGMNLLPAQNNEQKVEAAITYKSGRWASNTITYTIKPGTEPTVANAWTRAVNEINRYNVVKFVPSNNGRVKLGQQIAADQTEIGTTNNWVRNNLYTNSEAVLSVNPSLKRSEGNNYAQRQYATALHELGHVLGLKHDTCPNGVMYPYSRSDARTIDAEYLQSIKNLYGSRGAVAQAPNGNHVFNQTGVVRVNYKPGYGINLWYGYGQKWTGRRLTHGTNWKFFKVAYNNGTTWYNLGGNQWLQGKYLQQVR